MNALVVILGSPPGTHRAEVIEAGDIPTAPQIAATGSPGELLRRRPDLIVAEHRLAASSARIGVAVAEYYPKLSLSGLIGSATSESGGNLFTSGASQAAGVLGLSWRLFDFGRINAQIEQAKGQEPATSIARQSRVYSSTTVRQLQLLPIGTAIKHKVVTPHGVPAGLRIGPWSIARCPFPTFLLRHLQT